MTGPPQQHESWEGIHLPFQGSDVSIDEAVSFRASAAHMVDDRNQLLVIFEAEADMSRMTQLNFSSTFRNGSDSEEGPDKSGEHLPFKC